MAVEQTGLVHSSPFLNMERYQYVVAMFGARDSYQVPLALYNENLLSRLVTDFYAPEYLAKRGDGLPHRPSIPLIAHRVERPAPSH